MHLRVMSYNIHRAIGIDRRFRPTRITEIVAHHEPDVVLLQEVDSGVPRSREMDLARELADVLDFGHFAVGHNVFLRRGKYGNATLSKFPILRERNIDLTVAGRKRRGCQHTTIRAEKVPGRPHEIEVFNMHLGLSARERAHQLGILACSREFVSLARTRPCLVGGDFNDWRSLLEPLFTELLGFECATRRIHGRRTVLRTYPSFSPTGPLDRIYFRGRLRLLSARRCRLAISKVASDHLPVVADFELH